MRLPAWPRLSVLTLLLLCIAVPVWASTYYVATTGSDSTSCSSAQTSSTPRRTLGAGLACLAGSDTLTIASGTYTDSDITNVPSGTSGAPTTIQTAAGAQVIIQPSACSQGGGSTVLFDTTSYITLQGPGLIIDGSSCAVDSAVGIGIFSGAHHIIVQDVEVRNTNGPGIDFFHFPTDCRITRVKVHDIGRFAPSVNPPGWYGMYLNGRRNIVENSEVYNTTSWGIHAYSGAADGEVAEFTIRNNYVHDTNGPNANPNGAGGMLVYVANALGGNPGGNFIYNNIISHTNNTHSALVLYLGNGTNHVYNNTIYGNRGGGSAINLQSNTSGWIVRNNISYNNSDDSIVDNGSGNTKDHNLVGIDPLFANIAGNDFRLQAGSPAIDTGVNVGVSSDYNGTFRPQGAGFDIGAYEFVVSTPPVTATYYLSPTGSDGNTCAAAQSVASPKRTFASVLPCMGVSSTLYLRGGVYTESLDTSVQTIPAGTSYANPTLIASYPNETAIIQNPGVTAPIIWLQNPATDHYIIFDRLVLDGNNFHDANGFVTYPGVDHIRFQNGEIKTTTYEPVLIYQANQVEILTSQIHNPGQTFATLAITGSTGSVIRGNNIFNSQREGIGPKDNQSNTNLEISGNTIHQTGLSVANAALILGPSTNSLIMNNVLFGNAAGINVQTGASGVRLYNNTVTGNTNAGILIDSGASGTLVKNDIVFNNGSAITDNGTSTIQATNKLTDPLFVNAAVNNYQLQSTSTARDTGTTLSEVMFDFAGLRRPQGAAYDIGAYEFPITAAPRPPNGLIVAY